MLVRPQKGLVTTPVDFEIVTNFRDFDPHTTILVRKVQQRPKMECGGPKFCDISKSTGVVTKPFWGRTNIGLMFLFPWFDYGIDILKFEKSHFLAARVILGYFCPLKLRFFAVRTMSKSCVNLPRVDLFQKFFEKFLEMFLSYPGIYFGPPGTIWSLRKTILRKKSRKK